MGRKPCCEKIGLKRGPWSPEEDLILINYINKYGHNNWRALPKQAGLLRCGKSCRLRWINYLRPDIKRGNFTMEEEDTIIELHQMLGNRWSAIAARLPGRTDNEIKNVWHTHLKKKLQQKTTTKQILCHTENPNNQDPKQEESVNTHTHNHHLNIKSERTEKERPLSPPQCSSTMSTATITTTNHDISSMNNNNNFSSVDESINDGDNLALDEDFWSEVLSSNDSNVEARNFQDITIGDGDELKFQFPFSSLVSEEMVHSATSSSSLCHDMEFWYEVYTRAEELLPQL